MSDSGLQAVLEAKRKDLIARHEMVTTQLREQQIALAGAVAAVDEMLRELEAEKEQAAPNGDGNI